MDIVIPKDAVEILTNQLEQVLDAVNIAPKEKRYEKLPKDVVELVKISKTLAGEGKVEEAISVLSKAVKNCPGYSRGRLQLAMWHQKEGNTAIALFTAGHAYATATDKDTKCQLLTLSGDIAVAHHKTTRRKVELANAITFYSKAISEDESNPHPAWNLIEANVLLDKDYRDDAQRLLQHIYDQCSRAPGVHNLKLKKIVNDWENVLGGEFEEWREKIENLSNIIIKGHNNDNAEQRQRLTRRALTAALVAGGLILIANGGQIVKEFTDSDSPTITEQTTPEDSSRRSEAMDSDDGKMEVLNAGVEFDDQELTIAMKRGVEFSDSELT